MNGFQIIKAEESLTLKNLFVVLFGDPGVGKTSISFTMPKPILHLDFDNGVERAAQKVRPDTIKVDDYSKFHEWLHSEDFEIFIQTNGYKTVNLDTVGTLLDDYIANWLVKQDPKNGTNLGGLSLSGWGALSVTFNAIRNRFKSLGLEITAVCHSKEEGDDSARRIGLAVKGGSTDIIYRSCDMMGYVFMRGNTRMIEFSPTSLHVGKNVAGLEAMKIPSAETDAYDNFLSEKVIDACRNKMSELSQKQVDFKAKLEAFKVILSDCEFTGDFKPATDFVLQTSGTLQVQAGKMLEDAITANWQLRLDGCMKPEQFDALIQDLKAEPSKYILASVRKMLSLRLTDLSLKYNKDTEKVEYTELENAAAK